jgi:signal transduction histidine kinase
MRAAAPRTALAVLTGQDDETAALEALREGVEDYLIKGQADSRLLVRAIRYALERRRASNALAESEQERSQLLASERAARSDAERASRVKDEFLATISHELRTPLNAILGWSQVLYEGRLKNDQTGLQKGLEAISRNARMQAKIIEDLLDMSGIASGKLRLTVEPVSLPAVIDAAIGTVAPAANAKGIRVAAVVDTCVPEVNGDPQRLQQIVWNLLTNAVKFTPPGGRIEVVLRQSGSHAHVSVSDTGEGIADEFLPYVFGRFSQADGSTTRRHFGLGLGLAIVKQLTEMHGGRVAVQSAGVGKGSTFIVSLPLPLVQVRVPDNGTALQVEPVRRTIPTSLGGIKVLVVDDDPDARELASRVLEDYQAQVRTAASGPEALEMLATYRPDVLLGDINMPGMDGYALIRQIRALADSAARSIPAAAVTALARQEDRVRALLAGYQMHVTKPLDPAELAAAVATLAGRTPAP